MSGLLLIIDPQNDFVSPKGSLSVGGAVEDMGRLCGFIDKAELEHILITLDTHHPVHIATPDYWVGAAGEHPAPFAGITTADVSSGKWRPLYHKDSALAYLKALEEKGKNHTIWPHHCLYGTEGWAVYPKLYDTVYNWSRKHNKTFTLYTKGENSENTEMFSVVKPEVSLEGKDAKRAEHFLSLLMSYDKIYVAGEAENFCVKESVYDIVTLRPELTKKLVILRNCMSSIPVPGLDMDAFWGELEVRGAKISAV